MKSFRGKSGKFARIRRAVWNERSKDIWGKWAGMFFALEILRGSNAFSEFSLEFLKQFSLSFTLFIISTLVNPRLPLISSPPLISSQFFRTSPIESPEQESHQIHFNSTNLFSLLKFSTLESAFFVCALPANSQKGVETRKKSALNR